MLNPSYRVRGWLIAIAWIVILCLTFTYMPFWAAGIIIAAAAIIFEMTY